MEFHESRSSVNRSITVEHTEVYTAYLSKNSRLRNQILQFIFSRSVLEPEVVSKITFDVSGNLTATASGIHPPLVVAQPKAAVVAAQWEVLPYGLIIIAALILVLGSAGIVYICVSWARYVSLLSRTCRVFQKSCPPPPTFELLEIEKRSFGNVQSQIGPSSRGV